MRPHGNYKAIFDMITAPKSTLSLKVTKQLQFPSKLLEQTMNSSLRLDLASQIPALPGPLKSRGQR